MGSDLRKQVGSGRLDALRALRDVLAAQIDADGCCTCEKPSVSQMAPLAGRLVVVLEQIDLLEKATRRGSRVDEIANARKARRAGTPSGKSPRRSSVIGGSGSG